MKVFGGRKALFLATTARVGLHGGLLKDDQGHGDVEVGPGFAAAAAQAEPPKAPDPAANPVDNSDDGGEGDAGNPDDGDDDGEGDDDEKRDRKKTSDFIRELKRERRELRRELAQEKARNSSIDSRIAALENRGLPNSQAGDTNAGTGAKPDPNDTAKYPLGVLDDGYIQDSIDYAAEQKVREVLDEQRQTEQAQAEQDAAERQAASYREKVSVLAEAGSELHDDYEEVVLEAGLRGDYQLTETTFVAASEAEHGAQILYSLATDKKEAARVAGLSTLQQVKYVLEKDAEFAAKAKGRRKPGANPPPGELPAGRNPSREIRPDTDNLDEFRKAWYKK